MSRTNPHPDELLRLIDDGQLSHEEQIAYISKWSQLSSDDAANTGNDYQAFAQELKNALDAPRVAGEKTVPNSAFVAKIIQRVRDQVDQDTKVADHEQTELHAARHTDPQAHSTVFGSLGAHDLSGQMLGKYRITRKIGQGGMGVVYEAEDQDLKRRVALKTMLPKMASVPASRLRFLREARAAAQVEHDHVCPIHQVGEEQGIPFIAMPLLQGESLDRKLKRGTLSLDNMLRYGIQIASGLAAAHQVGLVHRDIKPANIWIEQKNNGTERIRILDFGLAHFDEDELNLTQSGTVMGTPSYMAPEQARGESVDARADLFSMGAIFYEMLTGRKAFVGANTASVITQLMVETPPAPADLLPSISKPLSELVMRLLVKNPTQRDLSAADVAEQLEDIRVNQLASPSGVTGAKPEAKQSLAQSRLHETSASGGRRKLGSWLWLTLISTGLIGLTAASIIIFQGKHGVLIVEFADETDVRFRDGKLQVFDDQGKLQYTITPDENRQNLPPGNYHVTVVGADGVQLSTDKFEIVKGDKIVLRVTSRKPESDTIAVIGPAANTETAAVTELFPGMISIFDAFTSATECKLQLLENDREPRFIEDQHYVVLRKDCLLEERIAVPFGKGLASGAIAVRCRAVNGDPFFNFCVRNDGTQARWLTLILDQGTWRVGLQRHDLVAGKWIAKSPTRLAFDDAINTDLMNGKWVEFAARWSDTDYDVWLNGSHLTGGALPTEELNLGLPKPPQVCAAPKIVGDTRLEIDYVTQWDQKQLTPSEAVPPALPGRQSVAPAIK